MRARSGARRRWTRLSFSVLGCLLIYFTLPVGGPLLSSSVPVDVLLTIAGTAALGWSIVAQIRRYLDSGATQVVDGLILTLVVVVVFFALAFFVVQDADPNQFVGLHTRLDSLYFTASTTTTVGYGDVHAEGQLARSLVTFQLAFNVIFIATVATLRTTRMRAVADASTTRHQLP